MISLYKIVKKVYYKLKYEYDLIKDYPTRYYDKLGIEIVNERQLCKIISTALAEEKPLCIGKIGGSEKNAIAAWYFGIESVRKKSYKQLCECAGFFPINYNEREMEKYFIEQIEAIKQVDILQTYPKIYEEIFLKKYAKSSIKRCLHLGTWMLKEPWTKELTDKKVLVISPFTYSIEKQYGRRKKLYKSSDYLPEFQLILCKAVQSIGGRNDEGFSSWFEALEYMYTKAMSHDFDIALIGCGAYSLPLAARLKKAGKIAIHLGGDLQMMFGIKGSRWRNVEEALQIYNDYWVFPDESEIPKDYKKVEGGCYW